MRGALPVLVAFACSGSARPSYPAAPRGDVVDTYGAISVPDPYRWLEAMDSPETRAWVAAENHATDAYFARLPVAPLRKRLAELFQREQTFLPKRRGAHVFWTHNDGVRDQPTLEVAPFVDAPSKTLVDPNAISNGKETFAGYAISDDGSKVVYGMAAGGGDWTRWKIRDVATGQDLPDELRDTKYYTPQFTHDGTALYYSHFPAPPAGKELTETDHDCKLYLHRLGTPSADDPVIYERPGKPATQFEPTVTRDGNFLVIVIGEGQVYDTSLEQIAVLDLARPGAKPIELVTTYASDYIFVGNSGATFYFTTNANAANRRIVAVDLAAPETWQQVIAETPRAISDATIIDRQLVVTYLHDVHAEVVAYDLGGKKLRDVELPGLGSAWGFGGSPTERDAFYWFTSFTTPGSVYHYDAETGTSSPWHAPKVAFDPSQFETTQEFFPSKDGTKVPMFITAKKGLKLDGTHPTVMTAYGFGGVVNPPRFVAEQIPWLERGGVAVLVNVRGGGEYGEAWHLAAKGTKRQTCLDDFIAAGEWLVANKWTQPAHLGAIGVSGGGFLVAAVLMQRPDLFGAVIPVAGVDDLLRFPLFGQGAGWQEDFGHPANPAEFPTLRAVSPLHNVRPGTRYPPVFVITSDHDVRVPPLHSYKLAAALQAAQGGSKPILLRVETESGHGGGRLISQEVEQQAEIYAFFADALGF